MANLTILRTYALKDPGDLPSSILFRTSESKKYITIFDAYPKSIFHFLILPRVDNADTSDTSPDADDSPALPKARDLGNLKSLLNTADKEKASTMIEELKAEALLVKKEIEDEMVERYGFKWDVWIGFHAVPSMVHLHLHVLSADLVSDRMKNKKHYNSFHPSLGYFLHIDEVLSWLDATPSFFRTKAQLSAKAYEDLLKGDLECWKCGSSMKNMPILKQHLQEEWDKQAAKAKRPATKRKASAELSLEVPTAVGKQGSEAGVGSKRSKTEEPPGDDGA